MRYRSLLTALCALAFAAPAPALAYPLTLCWDVAPNGANYDYTFTLVNTGGQPVGYINWLIFGDTGYGAAAGATTINGATLLSAPAGTTWTALQSSSGGHNGPTFLSYPLYASGWNVTGAVGQSITWRVRGTNRVGDNDLYWSYLLGTTPSANWERGVRSISWYRDADGDGYGDPSQPMAGCGSLAGYANNDDDCNDADAAINPAGLEVCDGVDQDCDGAIDDNPTGAPTWYLDGDSDGYGTPASTQVACSQPSGYAAASTDCDDARALTNPGAAEFCNSIDDDCDGTVDDNAADAVDWYADADADGYGDPATVAADCSAPAGYVADDTDCDDSDGDTNPGADEYCDGADDDCDGAIDEADAVDASTWYADADGDSYGDPNAVTRACAQPSGYVADSADCDDGLSSVNPGAAELCNGLDDDCDGATDEPDAQDSAVWYADADGDSYGDPSTTAESCAQPPGYVLDDTDCDDARASVNPAATEFCNGLDDDCDAIIDEADAADAADWYADADGDSYGDANAVTRACAPPSGYVGGGTDCDDGDAAINPGATEVCDGANTDEDCDGLADDADPGATGASTWYADSDGDGYGDPAATRAACDQPAGAVAAGGDCDDTLAGVNPGAQEVCDPLDTDEDCDGTADDGDSSVDASTASTWYADADSDGYGGTLAASACDQPLGHAATATDCDDSDPAYNPGAPEADCTDPNDYNCDGSVGYADDDGDTYAACVECDDSDPAVNPAAAEVAGDGVDSDCDGQELCYRDEDGDGYRPDDGTTASTALACDDIGLIGDTSGPGDCDDADPAYHPGAAEPDCTDPNDYNCDGSVGYVDADGDTYAACAECDDAVAAINPAAAEVCNGVDDDCDGTVDLNAADMQTFYADADGDGFTDPDAPISACGAPDGYLALTEADCDDADATVYPGAIEVEGDGIDQDCLDGDLPGDSDYVPDDPPADSGKVQGGGGCACSSQTGAPLALLAFGGLGLLARRRREG